MDSGNPVSYHVSIVDCQNVFVGNNIKVAVSKEQGISLRGKLEGETLQKCNKNLSPKF